jgi:inhibitor of KinA sporulation pathway (predicted exonuclease)
MKELMVSLDLELNQPSRRIIQIGAVIGNICSGEVVSRFDSKVSPNEELSPAIVKLTKIKQEEVDAAPKLRDAYELLKRWLE